MWKICAKFVPRVIREDQKERCCHDSREMVEQINPDPTVLDALGTCDESWIYCYDPETKRQSSQGKHAGSPSPKMAQTEQILQQTFDHPFFYITACSICTGFPLDRQPTRNTMLRFLGNSGRDSVGSGQYSSNRVSGLSTRSMHQSTTSSQINCQKNFYFKLFSLFKQI